MSGDENMRDYGLPNSEVVGTPTWKPTDPSMPCPNCGGQLCEVRVAVTQALLRGHKGTSLYLGCPACPYASPALITSDAATKAKGTDDGA